MSSNNTLPQSNEQQQQQQPGLIAGHAQYIKGAAEVRLSLLSSVYRSTS